ncbi:metalloregulator ArsR/SmtB family transcription factor [Halorientalis pallida]|uniref:Metalloregulator ArsR/SmtB family transcription factor n=1 Tax=Halorientalis pallida TaxID=2479928 RepID=A0A498L1B5_9EURY|nr:metalloregulator ArsR/SmtB family transcription factor [Halorientalis pallida]RXK51867.1 metalloregulator ArsR/SmtB family transcription factor [Halorientalis pallida]
MDSAELLNLLGNENRRRILRLLARKPCYVTEISEYLGVSPKAVIDHLRKLEEAGLVESRTDDQRRKYYFISQNLRLEVSVSPYGFGVKSAYPASQSLDVAASCRHLKIDVSTRDPTDLGDVATELARLEQLENELSMAQRWVQGRLAAVMEQLGEKLDVDDTRLYADVLNALVEEPATTDEIVETVEAPPPVVREALTELEGNGVLAREGDRWRLVD